MKLFITLLLLCISLHVFSQNYQPTPENLMARKEFQDNKFGLFIHWGLYSLIGRGEWVLNNDKIQFKNYKKLMHFFNPEQFDAAAWVRMAKDAGMKYITFVTRHHDGFSMWNTRYSDFNIMHTPYGKDILKMIADECHKQGVNLVLYYSLLDWGREDYPHESGRTGQYTGRTGKGNYAHYLQFMKNQLTELLTNYGKISGIWLDGHWDQTNPEGHEDRSSRIDWQYDELYGLIHQLQPACLIGNNHHLAPLPGEDFQMFERDLPGENTSGLNFQKASNKLPVEVCATMNNSWGFNLNDDHYKSVEDIIHFLVNAAGKNTNLLLNVGPMPNGKVQTEFKDTLKKVGEWMREYGGSIYGTRGKVVPAQDWGTVTSKGKNFFVHVLNWPEDGPLQIEGLPGTVKSVVLYPDGEEVKHSFYDQILHIKFPVEKRKEIDTILKVEME